MGRSVSYPSGAVVAFTVMEVEEDDDWDFEYEWLRDDLRERAAQRLDDLHNAGVEEARLYGHDPADGVGGDGAFFLLLDEPEVYGLPPDPIVPTRNLASTWKYTGAAAAGLAAAAVAAFLGLRRRAPLPTGR